MCEPEHLQKFYLRRNGTGKTLIAYTGLSCIERQDTSVHSAADIAVVVPTLNEADEIGATLRALVQGGFREIIVADGGSTDETAAIAASIAPVQLIVASGGRGGQLAAAISLSRAPVILMLHADTRLPASVNEDVLRVLAGPGVVGGCFRLTFREKQFWLQAAAWFTRFETRWTTFGDQAFFVWRHALELAGGVPDEPFLEDVILRSRLRRLGRFVKVDRPVETSGRRLLDTGVIRGQLRNAAVLLAFSLGVGPKTLVRYYSPRHRGSTGRAGGLDRDRIHPTRLDM